ncbi:unnamed protein product [Rodentolepis nana]|uniref:Uncharacterized protein n=1 Tax=Rodentolepis nana TaxID=102285 RepID=A0A0R3THK1_RODNA|nr:unnamed protein product [Rodentolepis nana]
MGSERASFLIVNSVKPRQRSMSIPLSRLRSPGDLKIVPTNHGIESHQPMFSMRNIVSANHGGNVTGSSTMVTSINRVQTQNQSGIESHQPMYSMTQNQLVVESPQPIFVTSIPSHPTIVPLAPAFTTQVVVNAGNDDDLSPGISYKHLIFLAIESSETKCRTSALPTVSSIALQPITTISTPLTTLSSLPTSTGSLITTSASVAEDRTPPALHVNGIPEDRPTKNSEPMEHAESEFLGVTPSQSVGFECSGLLR